MSYAPGAPAQIWAITGISDGAKLTLMHWWSKADHDVQREPRPCTVWAPAGVREDGSRMKPHESLIAELLSTVHPGKAERTLRGHIVELDEAGLASVDGRCVDLTPPSFAAPRPKSATPRRKSAGQNPPRHGENPPASGEESPESGENPPLHSYPSSPANTPHDPPTAGDPAPVECHPCTVADSPGVMPARSVAPLDPKRLAPTWGPQRASAAPPSPSDFPASPPPEPEQAQHAAPPAPAPKPRKRKTPRPKQGALDLQDPEPIDPLELAHAELLAEHERARAEAYAHHREAMPRWPGVLTQTGGAIRVGLRQALRDHGVDVCREALRKRAAEWRGDATKLRYSLASMWSSESLAYVLPGANGKRAGPSRGLPVEPDAPDRTYRFE
jgi:hypothetical protein